MQAVSWQLSHHVAVKDSTVVATSRRSVMQLLEGDLTLRGVFLPQYNPNSATYVHEPG